MDTKQCSTCKETLPFSSFYKNAAKIDGHQYSCKPCMQTWHRRWYQENSERHKRNVKKNSYKFKQRYYEFMQQQSCAECGESRTATLQWDHVDPSNKSFNVSDGLRLGYGWDKMMAEIAKCVCLCGNCHAVKTQAQFGWYKYQDRIEELNGK